MATSSITKNFVISGKEQVEMFVNAIEESAKNRPERTPVNVEFIDIYHVCISYCPAWENLHRPHQIRTNRMSWYSF